MNGFIITVWFGGTTFSRVVGFYASPSPLLYCVIFLSQCMYPNILPKCEQKKNSTDRATILYAFVRIQNSNA